MSKLSFISKLGILIDISLNSKIYLVLLLVLIFFGIALVTTNKKNNKTHKMIYISVTIFMLLFIFLSFHEPIGKLFSYMMNNFFIVVFFPNLAVYLAALIVTNIILWISIFSFKSSKQIKILNVVMYIIMNYLFALILNTVKTQGIDLYNQTAVYGNKNVGALISLSSTIFIIWVIFLIIYKILLIYLRKDYKPKIKRIIVKKKVKKLPENFVPLETPDYIYARALNKKEQPNPLLKEMESMFSLKDYKLMSKMLKEQKQKDYENNNSGIEIIEKPTIEKEIIKEEEKPIIEKETIKEEEKPKEEVIKIEDDEQIELKKYNELLELYKIN